MQRFFNYSLFIIILFSILLCSACNRTKNSELDGDLMLDIALSNFETVKNLEADLTTTMQISFASANEEMTNQYHLATFQEPFKVRVNKSVTDSYSDKAESVDTEYLVEEEGRYYLYGMVADTEEWTKTALAAEKLTDYLIKDNVAFFVQNMKDFERVAIEEDEDGFFAAKYEGVIHSADLADFFYTSFTLNPLNISAAQRDDYSAVIQNAPDLPITLWIGIDVLYPHRYELDASALIQQVWAQYNAGNPNGPNYNITQYTITLQCDHFNQAENFQIPAEAMAETE